jgi:spore germination protein KC
VTATTWAKTIKLTILFCSFTMLTGCWDRIEIEERAILLGISVDVAKPQDAKQEKQVTHLKETNKYSEGKILLTAQLAVPGRIPLGPTGGGGGGGGTQKPVWVISAVGASIDDAMMTLQQQVAFRLFFGHLRVIVISEDIAKKGIQNLNDYMRRNPEVRRTVWLLVSKGEAKKAMLATPPLERVPTTYLTSTMDQAVKLGKLPPDFAGIFWSATSSKGQDPFLPYIEVRENNIFTEGLAYFKGNKMVGATEPLEIGYVMALRNVKTGGYSVLLPIGKSSNTVTLETTSRDTKVKAEIKNGMPHFTLDVHLDMNIIEKSSEAFQIGGPDVIQQIQKRLTEASEKGQLNMIKKTQEKGADIFGFGEYVRAKFPSYWNQEIKTKSRWEEMYKKVTFDNHVTMNIRRVGMKAR